MSVLIIVVGAVIVGLAKSTADVVSHIDIWKTSILSKYSNDSFWGPKDVTWIRKDNSNAILNWLFHYPLVFVTDIWHCSNTIRLVGYCLVCVGFNIAGTNVVDLLILLCVVRQIVFNLFYHKILRKSNQ